MKNQPFETAQKCEMLLAMLKQEMGCVLSDDGLLAQVSRLNKEIKPISSTKSQLKGTINYLSFYMVGRVCKSVMN